MVLLPRSFKIFSGQSLVEIIVAMGLAVLILPAVYLGLATIKQNQAQFEQRSVASGLMRQMVENVRQIRQHGWVYFAHDGTFHNAVSATSAAILATGPITENGYNRSIIISPVSRDGSGKIVTSGGSNDPSTKKVAYSVSWETPTHTSLTSTAYMTRYMDNLAYTETTYAQFTASGATVSGTIVNHTGGGAAVDGDITLGGGGHGDWCLPNLNLTQVNLDKSGVANALTAIEGRAFAGTGENASGPSFDNVLIDNNYPPQATVSGSFDGYKTNGIFGEAGFAYMSTDTNSKQGVIIDLNSLNSITHKYSEAGNLNLQSSSTNGKAIYVANNIAYLSGSNSKLYAFNISSKSGNHNSIANVSLAGVANKIVVAGNNIYAAINSSSTQLQIIPLTNNGQSFGTPINISVNGGVGKDVYVDPTLSTVTRAYLASASNSSKPEMFIINVDPASGQYRQTLSSYDTNGMDPYGITVVTNNKAIIVGHNGIEYQVVDLGNDSITSCSSGLNVDSGINGVASVVEQDGDAYSYIITGDSSSEFKIIEGGPSGRVGTSGYYLSAIHDFGASTAINRLSFTGTIPGSTTLGFQVAMADPVSNSCTNANYVFTDIDSTGAIPYDDDGSDYENPARCMRYRLNFATTVNTSTPVLNDITFNYSP
jgi:hypothetical protein